MPTRHKTKGLLLEDEFDRTILGVTTSIVEYRRRMKAFKTLFSSRRSAGPSGSSSGQHGGPGPSNAGAGSNSSQSASGNNNQGSSRSWFSSLKKQTLSFNVRVDSKMWPTFDLSEDTGDLIGAGGRLLIDYTERLAAQWAAGANVGPYFGRPIFPPKTDGLDATQLPPLLFDLVQNRVVRTADLGRPNYAIVSHVWGPTMDIDGLKYGVDWKIPIRNENTLLQILEAARVVVGERYIWMDILCLDQRKRNELEIAKMKSYYANATGCLVWLDNPYDDASWRDVLNAIKKVNAFFKLDQYGTPLPGSLDGLFKGESAWGLNLKDDEAFTWIQEFCKLETAPWFRRVWTLQEGVVPDNVYFCTPERYMTGGANIWTIAGLCEMMANLFLEQGSMLGTAILHQLQRSEIHKMLRLRLLYRRREISYWHLAQAVRTRDCKYEQDRVFGVCGMIHKTVPVINYDRSIEGLYEDLYKTYIDDGDFSPCLFLGGRSLLPDKDVSMGYIRPMQLNRQETYSLVLTQGGLRMSGIGIDKITKVHCILGSGPLKEWNKRFPEFLSMPIDAHFDVARAFGLDATPYKDSQVCPASFAAFLAISGNQSDDVVKLFDKVFQDQLYSNMPSALLQWIRAGYLMQNREDSALAMIWTQSSGVQLAVVTEPVEGNVLAVMPSSYKTEPGAGCLICQILPNGNMKKIGIGLGKACKASDFGNFLLIS